MPPQVVKYGYHTYHYPSRYFRFTRETANKVTADSIAHTSVTCVTYGAAQSRDYRCGLIWASEPLRARNDFAQCAIAFSPTLPYNCSTVRLEVLQDPKYMWILFLQLESTVLFRWWRDTFYPSTNLSHRTPTGRYPHQSQRFGGGHDPQRPRPREIGAGKSCSLAPRERRAGRGEQDRCFHVIVFDLI